jgi:small-conductance mechanosensitive channel
MFMTYLVAFVLMGLSGALLDAHRRSWRLVKNNATIPDRDMRFARSQYRRRMQASGTIGVLGAAIAVFPLVPHRPLPITMYLLAIALACFAILLLAAADFWATRQHFVRLRSEHLAIQAKLLRELAREHARRHDS